MLIQELFMLKSPGNTKDVRKDKAMKDFDQAAEQYSPMISAIIRKLHIYRDYDAYRQIGKIALWHACCRYEESKGDFTPFAYRSIHGAMLDELKRESRFTSRFAASEDVLLEEVASGSIEDRLPEWLDEIRLTRNERKLLDELFVQGVTVSDLAPIYGLSVSGMKKRRERVLKKVRSGMPAEFFK